MHTEVKEKWVQALRSGEKEQTRGSLCKRIRRVDGLHDCFCCLGVLSEVAIEEGLPVAKRRRAKTMLYTYNRRIGMPPRLVLSWAGITEPEAKRLARQNDIGWSFNKIADYIEENL